MLQTFGSEPLIAKNGGTINVGSTTTVTGAVVTSENVDKPLIIKTTELITNNLQDNDESTNTTIGFGGITTATPIPKTHLTYDDTDKEQNTLATMSNVIVNTGSGQVDLASKGINTDVSKAQEVTKDEETHIDIDIPTDLLNSKTRDEFFESLSKLVATPGDIIAAVQSLGSPGENFFYNLEGMFAHTDGKIENKAYEEVFDKIAQDQKEKMKNATSDQEKQEIRNETAKLISQEINSLANSKEFKEEMGLDPDERVVVILTDSNKKDEEASRLRADGYNVVFVDASKVNVSSYDAVYNVIVAEITHDNKTNPYVRGKSEEDVKSGSDTANLEEEYTQLGNSVKDNDTSFYEEFLNGTDALSVGNVLYNAIDTNDLEYSASEDAVSLQRKIDRAKKDCNQGHTTSCKNIAVYQRQLDDVSRKFINEENVKQGNIAGFRSIEEKELEKQNEKQKTINELSSSDCNGKCRKELQLTQDAAYKAYGERLACSSGSKGCDPGATGYEELIVFATDEEMYEYAEKLTLLGIRKNYRITSQETIDRDFNKLSDKKFMGIVPSAQDNVIHDRVSSKMYQFGSSANELYKSGKISSEDLSVYNSIEKYIDDQESYGAISRDVVGPMVNSIYVGKLANETYKGSIEESVNPQKVIGHYPEYIKLSEDLGVTPFSIPEKIWNNMSLEEQWSANQKFLDRAITKGTEFNLATPIDKVRPGTFLEREIEYLKSQGYELNEEGNKFIKQGD